MAEIILTKDNFDKEVLESDKPVLIDFWASWCGPCQMMAPVVAEIAKEHPEYKICKINVDEQQELAMRYNVMSIPFFTIFKNGEQDRTIVGVQPKDVLLKLLQ